MELSIFNPQRMTSITVLQEYLKIEVKNIILQLCFLFSKNLQTLILGGY